MVQDSLQVVRRVSTLKHQVTDGLRASIFDMRFGPGDRLVERELCELFDVSRTLVREAISQLVAEGLIQVIPHKGPIVAVVTPQEAEGLYKVRAEMEALAGREFVNLASAEERSALVRALEKLKEHASDESMLDFLKAKTIFYEVLLAGAHNPVLFEMLRLIHGRVTTLRAATLADPGRLAESLRELSNVVKAVEQNDAEAAAEALRLHVRNAAAIAKKLGKIA